MAGLDKHLWAPHKAQRIHETLYRLRRCIRRGIGVDEDLRSVRDELGEDLESLFDEVLQSKCHEDGQTLLMYAANQGNEAWLLRLVLEIRSRRGLRAVVKELQEVDNDGAPLLFHAVSSRREHSCFQTARDLIYTVLGKGGLMKQTEAVDLLGRGILMHAARSNHVATFTQIFVMVEETILSAIHFIPTSAAPVGSAVSEVAGVSATGTRAELVLGKMMGNFDRMGMSCLHHAAEAGCTEVLREVIAKYGGGESSVYQKVNKADKFNRTPIMLVLRNTYGGKDDEASTNILKDKFDLLYGAMPNESATASGAHTKKGWMDPTPVSLARRRHFKRTRAVTELVHAVRGGVAALRLALNNALPSAKADGDDCFAIHLDEALAVEESEDHQHWVRTNKTRVWGRAMLLAAAVLHGDVDVVHHAVAAIEQGKFILVGKSGMARLQDTGATVGEKVKEVMQMIQAHRTSLFGVAILSGRTQCVGMVYELVVSTFGHKTTETWHHLSGLNSRAPSLTCAAPASMDKEYQGTFMFDLVYDMLRQQAPEPRWLADVLLPRRSSFLGWERQPMSPLVGAAVGGNWVLFRKVYDLYEELTGHRWRRERVIKFIQYDTFQRSARELELPECSDMELSLGAERSIPAVMWRDIVQAIQRSEVGSSLGRDTPVDKTPPPPWKDEFKDWSRKVVKVACRRRSFTSLRDLVKEGFPLHNDHIPAILEHIGDWEEDVIDTLLYAVASASNPFVAAAGLSRTLATHEVEYPMHQEGLGRLQGIIDDFNNQLLDKLPHTVREVGVKLLGGFLGGPCGVTGFSLFNAAGFMVVQWILEPKIHLRKLEDGKRYSASDHSVDPLWQALDRGPKGMDFLSSPLVQDYLRVKFTGTLPPWTSRDPFQPDVNEVFYKHDDLDKPQLHDDRGRPVPATTFCWMSFLSRFLQGIPEESNFNGISRLTTSRRPNIPNSTVLPGLQFSLAGILGKPEVLYNVPVVRFAYEIFSYVVMLVLFCTSVVLQNPKVIPVHEAMFYVFATGQLWRLVLEFRDNFPARLYKPQGRSTLATRGTRRVQISPTRRSPLRSRRSQRLSSRFARIRTDSGIQAMFMRNKLRRGSWLRTSTICCVLLAFGFRMMGLALGFSLFYAQFFYALSSPLLFSRLLVPFQFDATLGLMTQVVIRVVVMLSFALAFHAAFHTCRNGTLSADCTLDDDAVENPLGAAFGTFQDSIVTTFTSTLGGPDFGRFDAASSGCGCNLPDGAEYAGIFLMAVSEWNCHTSPCAAVCVHRYDR
ncbi:unnamed protein product [Ectocarpus sp. 12 AP-2014]